MIAAKYDAERQYDALLENIIDGISTSLNDKEDDFLLLCVGTAGTGKSMLMLHCMDYYLKEKASVDFVGLNRASFSEALHSSTDDKLPRFCANDEANISKRDSMTKYNKDIIDLYLSIRELRIFHWWNNPSLDIMDKFFIEERIKGIIFISTKDHDRPRVYYYFRKQDLLKVWKKYKRLNLEILKRVSGKYAYYKGWFRMYDGKLLEKYKMKKLQRMTDKIGEFYEKYGENTDTLKRSVVAKQLNVTSQTIQNHLNTLLKDKKILQSDIIKSPTGITYVSKNIISIIKKSIEEKTKKKIDVIR